MIYEIIDCLGETVQLEPRVELYSVNDFMGREMPGLAIILDEVSDTSENIQQYAVLTVSFGEFIGMKNCAYIDTNNCSFAEQLLKQGIGTPTGLSKSSGYCKYPLWEFNEEFLQEIGGEKYQIYTNAYDKYMNFTADEEIDESESMSMGGL